MLNRLRCSAVKDDVRRDPMVIGIPSKGGSPLVSILAEVIDVFLSWVCEVAMVLRVRAKESATQI